MSESHFGEAKSGLLYQPGSTAAYWPVGELASPHADLPWLLLGAARDSARRAITTYASGEHVEQLQAAVAVGTAVELAAKACVAWIEPALLAEKGQVEAVLWLTGHNDLTTVTAMDIRTIGGVEAAKIARDRSRGVVAPQDEVLKAMNVRNAATHMAFVERGGLRREVVTMVRIVDSIVVSMQEDRSRFWETSSIWLMS